MNNDALDNIAAEIGYKAACLEEDIQAIGLLFTTAESELSGCDNGLSEVSIVCFARRYSLFQAAWGAIERDALAALEGIDQLQAQLEQMSFERE